MNLPWTLTGGRGLFGLPPIQGALLLWVLLMAFTLLFVLLAGMMARWQWGRLNRAEARALAAVADASLTPAARASLRSEASELVRQAAATAAAAKRARMTVTEARSRAEAAQQAREMAWEAFDVAQKAYEQAVLEANAHANAAEAAAGEVGDDDRREVSKAALAAFKRGDISVEELGQVFRGASGWDPLQELQAREVELRRSAESRARRLYQAAAAAERIAVTAADVAVVAAQALAEEAVEVAEEAIMLRGELDAARRSAITAAGGPKKARSRVPRQRAKNARADAARNDIVARAETSMAEPERANAVGP